MFTCLSSLVSFLVFLTPWGSFPDVSAALLMHTVQLLIPCCSLPLRQCVWSADARAQQPSCMGWCLVKAEKGCSSASGPPTCECGNMYPCTKAEKGCMVTAPVAEPAIRGYSKCDHVGRSGWWDWCLVGFCCPLVVIRI